MGPAALAAAVALSSAAAPQPRWGDRVENAETLAAELLPAVLAVAVREAEYGGSIDSGRSGPGTAIHFFAVPAAVAPGLCGVEIHKAVLFTSGAREPHGTRYAYRLIDPALSLDETQVRCAALPSARNFVETSAPMDFEQGGLAVDEIRSTLAMGRAVLGSGPDVGGLPVDCVDRVANYAQYARRCEFARRLVSGTNLDAVTALASCEFPMAAIADDCVRMVIEQSADAERLQALPLGIAIYHEDYVPRRVEVELNHNVLVHNFRGINGPPLGLD